MTTEAVFPQLALHFASTCALGVEFHPMSPVR
jgi:hypothetical protein